MKNNKMEYDNYGFPKLGLSQSQKWPEKDIIAAKKKKKDLVGLSLSGGGYRSAIFSYGILKGLYEIGVINKIDYLSCVSGGSWMGAAFSISKNLNNFFNDDYWRKEMKQLFFLNKDNDSEKTEKYLKSAVLPCRNWESNLYASRLAHVFLEELKDNKDNTLLSDNVFHFEERPFLILNCTFTFEMKDIVEHCPDERFIDSLSTQSMGMKKKGQVFEMTPLYSGCNLLGYIDTKNFYSYEMIDLDNKKDPLKLKEAIGVSGAAVAGSLDDLSLFLTREMTNYDEKHDFYSEKKLQLVDGGQSDNLGIESLIRRGCSHLIIIDAEHDDPIQPEDDSYIKQNFSALQKVMKRLGYMGLCNDILKEFYNKDVIIKKFQHSENVPSVIYVKLRKNSAYNKDFNPMFETSKLQYSEEKFNNLFGLGYWVITKNKDIIVDFINSAQ